MLIRAYVALDSFLLDRANDVTKAWNWTTGRTRADLATLISVPAFSSLPASYFINGAYGTALFFGALSGLLIFLYIDTFIKMDRLESGALNSDTKNLELEVVKNKYKIYGPIFNLLGFASLVRPNSENLHPLSNEISSVFGFGIGTTMYVMRTDYQAPRKNVVVRAKDKLADMLRQPTTIPLQHF